MFFYGVVFCVFNVVCILIVIEIIKVIFCFFVSFFGSDGGFVNDYGIIVDVVSDSFVFFVVGKDSIWRCWVDFLEFGYEEIVDVV